MKNATAQALQPNPNSMLRDYANAIRALAMDAVEQAKSGHPGMPMGMADVATILFSEFLRIDPLVPHWPNRDRFVLSAGHGSMLQYALAYLLGYPAMSLEQIKKFRQLHSKTPGHPERDLSIGVETTTGPLGQGIATAVGMALAERLQAAQLGEKLVDHKTYVIASDGDLMEGISHEAASLAGHLALNRLIVLWDDNDISIDGPTNLSWSDNTLQRFAAYGWETLRIDGHDFAAIRGALQQAQQHTKPTLIACKTTIGYGAPKKAGTKDCHGSPLGAEEIAGARQQLGWVHPPFEIPAEILDWWRQVGARCQPLRLEWEKQLNALPMAERQEFLRREAGQLPNGFIATLQQVKEKFLADAPKQATRQLSGTVLEALMPVIPELVGGSADLTGSNNTQVKAAGVVRPHDFAGRYIHYGVREHGMAAAMNGMALHGGIIPYSGTFLQFTDYCRPSIRLAALMRQRVIFVMTHDSIGLGEDGPTHQPVEHLAALRVIPNLLVLRPADPIEVAECWELALQQTSRPSVLVLTRQNVPLLRTSAAENWSAKGAYMLQGQREATQITLVATGSEVGMITAARAELAKQGIKAAVVSCPSLELFLAQSAEYQAATLGTGPRIFVEAAVQQSWDRLMRPGDAFIGMNSFGESAPAPELYEHFGITPAKIAAKAKELLA